MQRAAPSETDMPPTSFRFTRGVCRKAAAFSLVAYACVRGLFAVAESPYAQALLLNTVFCRYPRVA